MSILTTLFLTWQVAIMDFDDSINKYNALLEASHDGVQYKVAVESDSPFTFKEREYIRAMIKFTCFDAKGIDEKASDLTNSWVSYNIKLCNATEIIYP